MALAGGMAAVGCGSRPVEAPAPLPTAPAEDGIRLVSELLQASPTALTIDGQSFLVMAGVTYEDRYASVNWQLYRYENGRFIRVEVLDKPPAATPQPPE